MRNTVIGLAAAAAIVAAGSTLSASACGRHSGQHYGAQGPRDGYGKYGRPRGGYDGRYSGTLGSQRYGRYGER